MTAPVLLDHNYDLAPLQAGYADFVRRWSGEDDAEFKDARFHSSSLGKCERQAILSRAGKKGRPDDEDKASMFAEANFIHAGMTNFWMKNGLGIAREHRMTDPTGYEGWSGKFDLYAHNQDWCGCDMSTELLANYFKSMVETKKNGGDWHKLSRMFASHMTFLLSLKTVAPAGLRHYVSGPALHNVWQDTTYGHWLHSEYEVPLPRFIAIMYRSRGGSASPIWHLVEPFDKATMDAKMTPYNVGYDTYLEQGVLPPVLPFVVKRATDKLYPSGLLTIDQNWMCSYCEYAGWHNDATNFRCECKCTNNQGADRAGVINDTHKTITLCKEWYSKGHTEEEVRALVTDWLREEHLKGYVIEQVNASKSLRA